MGDLLTQKEAAARLGVSLRTVVRWGLAGTLDRRRIGPKLIRVTAESVDQRAGEASEVRAVRCEQYRHAGP